MSHRSIRNELRDKLIKLFEELDVPTPLFTWKLASDKKLVDMYERYARGVTFCEGCKCVKKQLREEIDTELFEDIVLRGGSNGSTENPSSEEK